MRARTEREIDQIMSFRERLDSAPRLYSPEFVRSACHKAYGRSVSDRTWGRWLIKCGISSTLLLEYGGSFPEGAYFLLVANARLLRGNGPGERRKKVSRPALVASLKGLNSPALLPAPLPHVVSYSELKSRAEAQAGRAYSDRSHRKKGLRKSQAFYSQSEALQILSQYPEVKI